MWPHPSLGFLASKRTSSPKEPQQACPWQGCAIISYTKSWKLRCSSLHQFTLIYINLYLFMSGDSQDEWTNMQNRKTSKEIPIHNGGGQAGPPLWIPLWMGISLFIFLLLHIGSVILAVPRHWLNTNWCKLTNIDCEDVNRHKLT
jgi:hypothetical protein